MKQAVMVKKTGYRLSRGMGGMMPGESKGRTQHR